MSNRQTPFADASDKPGTSENVALFAAIGWLLIAGLMWWFLPGTIGLIGIVVPLVLLTAAYFQSRQLRLSRQEAARLRTALDLIKEETAARQTIPTTGSGRPSSDANSPPAQVPTPQDIAPTRTDPDLFDEMDAVLDDEDGDAWDTPAPLFRSRHAPSNAVPAQPAETAPDTTQGQPSDQSQAPSPTFASRRDGATPQAAKAPAGNPQGQLALGPEHDARPPLGAQDFIAALNFPQTPDDTDGFRALRLALRHPPTAPLVQASQDVLTLMSQNCLYMDDLAPDHTRPDLWRRFADGERGGVIGGLGAIRDTDALLTCANQMRDDLVFRDATHHFLRRFDQILAARIDELTDSDLIRLADTRTARAFMVLGRAAGIFD